MTKTGLVCARKGFKMEQILRRGQIPLNAKVKYWDSGVDIFVDLDLTLPPENATDTLNQE